MSQFNGWVRIRRGIVEHIMDGRLTPFEYLALMQLILMADAATGGGTINAPTLMYRTGYAFSLRTAQRVLRDLHVKGYIWYRAEQNTKRPRPYWVNKYVISSGAHSLAVTNLAELADKSVVCQDDVFKCVAQPGGQPSGKRSDEYKTRDQRQEKRETSPPNFNATENRSAAAATAAAAGGGDVADGGAPGQQENQNQVPPSSKRKPEEPIAATGGVGPEDTAQVLTALSRFFRPAQETVDKLIAECRERNPAATMEEIARAVEDAGNSCSRNVRNKAGVIITQAPLLLDGDALPS